MFDNLTDRLKQTLDKVRGKGRLTEDNIKETLREVRMALLEADVALPVARSFIENIREKAVGAEVLSSLTPGQALIKIVNDELIHLMGDQNDSLDLNTTPPATILMAGLQGSGKTTTVAKLARWLREREKKKVMVCSCDVYRPAAIDQLETLARQIQVEFFPSTPDQKPVEIARCATDAAKKNLCDILIIDTAGRLHVDEDMMTEIQQLHQAIDPVETLFVVDSMTGQDAVNTAKAFGDALPLTGVVLTKTDGDARGGAALSVRHVTGKPIKFLGVGEKTDALEPFHPDRIASRILGMGDVLSLVEEIEHKVDKKKAAKLAKKLARGKQFDLEDFRDQLQQIKKMGNLTSLLEKMPGMSQIPDAVKNQVNDKSIMRIEAIINSMTPHERQFPKIINGSRKKRIARGSGVQIQDVNKLLKQFSQMQRMAKKVTGGKSKLKNMMRGLKGQFPSGPGGGMPF
ncbi:MAG: signal recognition particle protein [Gammaproteobacteria bacterium]|nr:MAG: signal recognition particle protein [Gammaproteobacteria bacterium]